MVTKIINCCSHRLNLGNMEVLLMDRRQYICSKCGCYEYESDQFQATGGNFAKLFDVQNKKFITVSCRNCGFTELYKSETTSGWNILDFFTN